MSEPTAHDGDVSPAPPCPPPPRGSGHAARSAQIQRNVCLGPTRSTLVDGASAWPDWVMEAEVPSTPGTFLQWPTRRAFAHDNIQLRVQVNGVQLSSSAQVSFEVIELDVGVNPNDPMLAVTTQASDFDADDYELGVSERSLQSSSDAQAEGWDVTSEHIVVEADATHNCSYVLTTINLPGDPSRTEHDDLELQFNVTIRDGGQLIRGRSPRLDVRPWWIRAVHNLGHGPTRSARPRPLIDGSNYFAAVLGRIQTARQHVYVASWSFDHRTPVGGGLSIRQALLAAAQRGVKVHVLLDYHNGTWAYPEVLRFLAHANVSCRVSKHPYTFALQQMGAYHEKYVTVDGRYALLGGIDFMPDRQSAPGHATRLHPDHWPWHDCGVEIDGHGARQVERNFAYRWNAGIGINQTTDPAGEITYHDAAALWDDLEVPHRLGRGPTTGHNVQVIKTDDLHQAHLVPHGYRRMRYTGTMKALERAIETARHYIYIENQYINHEGFGDAIEAALRANAALQVIAVIPFVTEEMERLQNAPRFGERYFGVPLNRRDHYEWLPVPEELQNRAVSHATWLQASILRRWLGVPNAADRVGVFGLARCMPPNAYAEMIYPHSKTMIVDDTWAYIGSANFNGRSLSTTDAEIGVSLHHRGKVTEYRRSLWQEHLGVPGDTRDIREFYDLWHQNSVQNRASPSDASCGELATTHAMQMSASQLPHGQRYNGPLSSVGAVDDLI
ncbi:MAG: phospholipase D-like domain-containing protein [Myxococcota bacterium]